MQFMSRYRKVGQTARAIGAGFLILISGCAANHKSSFVLEHRPIPIRIFVQRTTVENQCVYAKGDYTITKELSETESFYSPLGITFEIQDWFYFNYLSTKDMYQLSDYYNDSLNIFYIFPRNDLPQGRSDFPWEYPQVVLINDIPLSNWKLLAHEFGHGIFGLRHVHYDGTECMEDGCSDTPFIPLTMDGMDSYPNVMTYSLSSQYFITPQQMDRIKLWYKIRYVYKVYGPELTNPFPSFYEN